jgi:kinesin family protein 3/17
LPERNKEVKARMELKESPDKGVFIKDLTINVVKSSVEMEKYMTIGTDNRLIIGYCIYRKVGGSNCNE